MSETQPKRIVITGVSRGLGRALVEQFVPDGHIVAGCCRSSEAAAVLDEQYESPCSFTAVDVADAAQVSQWADRILGSIGPPDLLLNNAALMNHGANLWEAPVAEFSELIDVNIKGVFHVLRSFLPAMVERRAGVIVNFSSGWGRSTSPDVAPYCASKWAVEGLTRALADELPPGMAAVPLNPGVIHTEMLERCFGAGAAAYPTAAKWAQRAAPFLLGLNASHNGDPLTAPG